MTGLFKANFVYSFVDKEYPSACCTHSNAIISYPAAMSASPIMTSVDEVTLSG